MKKPYVKPVPYTEEERSYMIKTLVNFVGDKGVPRWKDAIRHIDSEKPGMLRCADGTKATYLAAVWKRHNPLKGLEKEVKAALGKIENNSSNRKSLIEMLKTRAHEFLIKDWDSLSPRDKAQLVAKAIELDANEEKIEIERSKLGANKRMMDNLASALMSGDHKAILSKYEIELLPEQTVTIIPSEGVKNGSTATNGDTAIEVA